MFDDLDISLPTNHGVAVYPPGATFGPRRMRDYEMVWLIEGQAEYTCNGVMLLVPPDSLVLCRPNTTDFFQWDTRQRTRHAFFHFDVYRTPTYWPPIAQWATARRGEDGDVLRPLFRHVLTWAGKGSDLQCRLSIATLLTAFLTGETAALETPRTVLPEPVERACAEIHTRLEEDPAASLSLHHLAQAACVTPEYLCRLFKQATRKSPMETVRLARLDRAAVLLTRSNYSVAEIARICGFSSAFHFSRRFKEAFAQTPTEARVAVREGATPPVPRLLRQR